MYRVIILFLCAILSVLNLKAQISEGGVPYSSTMAGLKSSAALPKFILKSIDIEQLLAEDLARPSPYRYAVFQDTAMNLKTFGKTDIIPGKGRIWRLRINSQQAKSLQILFNRFVLPPHANIFIYNENQSLIRGAFTGNNMHKDSSLVLADFPGNHIIIEYFEPENPQFEGEIIIGSISQAYRDILEVKSSDGYVNINCPDGKNAQLEKHAVSKLTFRSDGYSYLCSGALINNARNDGTPYFLTAHHCISKTTEASSLVAYFNYENEGCDGPETAPLTITGSSLLTTADSSDYSLLLLNSVPPGIAQPFYAGWDVNDTLARRVTGIHHPNGMSKKISIDFDSIYTNPVPFQWEGSSVSPVNSHWVVEFDVGVTGGGSSGSPLFNGNKQIIGQLHGGSEEIDFYGRLSFSWANAPAGYPGLRKFLDPDSTGILVLNGYYPADNPPDAFFTLPAYKICVDAPVMLQDYSVFEPYDRTWHITPETFIFDDGTSDTSPAPIIRFTEPGSYTVALILAKASGRDTMTISDAFLAGDTIQVSVVTAPSGEICACDFNQIQLSASGAAAYSWSILPEDVDKVTLNTFTGDTVMVSPVTGVPPDSAFSFNIRAVGTHGTCLDTLQITYQVLKPENDNILNATLLSYGKSISYNNICATIETGEPVPPFTSCTSQLSWCDEYGTGKDIVENSVWFKFFAPPSGVVRVWSTGMDNELALYEADSENDILIGNYTLLGANDDRTGTDFHPNIRSVDVIPAKTYWVQADGSGGGLEGEFFIHLYEVTSSGIEDLVENKLLVYPQPASDRVFLKAEEFLQHTDVFLEVFNSSGLLFHQEKMSSYQGTAVIDVSGWAPGAYVARIIAGNIIYTTRILKY